jgi:hypothetical protein
MGGRYDLGLRTPVVMCRYAFRAFFSFLMIA